MKQTVVDGGSHVHSTENGKNKYFYVCCVDCMHWCHVINKIKFTGCGRSERPSPFSSSPTLQQAYRPNDYEHEIQFIYTFQNCDSPFCSRFCARLTVFDGFCWTKHTISAAATATWIATVRFCWWLRHQYPDCFSIHTSTQCKIAEDTRSNNNKRGVRKIRKKHCVDVSNKKNYVHFLLWLPHKTVIGFSNEFNGWPPAALLSAKLKMLTILIWSGMRKMTSKYTSKKEKNQIKKTYSFPLAHFDRSGNDSHNEIVRRR